MFLALMLSVLVTTGAPPQTAASGAGLKGEITALHERWYTAFAKGDGATMDTLETDNLVLVFDDATMWRKTGSRVGTVKPLDPTLTWKLSEVDVRAFGDTAVLTAQQAESTSSKKSDGAIAITVVCVRQGGVWRIASAHWSSVVTKK